MKANIKKALTGIVLLAMLLTAILPYTAIAVEGTTNSANLTDNGNVTGENLLANAATDAGDLYGMRNRGFPA